MRYAIPLILLLAIGAFLWFTPFAPSSPPTHDADAAIALALATFVPCEVQAHVSPQDPKCDCGCADGKPCKCKECPDVLTVSAPVIPPCGCGCMQGKGCQCENCCKRTADPNWKPLAKQMPAGVSWSAVDFDAAASAAAADGRCVFVEVSGPGCVPCKQMEATFADPVVAAILNARYVSMHVDTSKHPAFAAALSVTRIPTHIVFGSNRVLHWNETGYRDSRQFAADLIQAADEHPVNVFAPAPVQSFAPQIQYQPQRFFAPACRSGH